METVTILQIVILFSIFGICFICVLLPIKLIPKNGHESGKKSARILSFCNCFSGGVFLGTCFLQLIPLIESKFNEAFYATGVSLELSCPVAQVTISLGFFLILWIEQLVRIVQQRDKAETEDHELMKIPLISDEEGESENEEVNEGDVMLQNNGRKKAKTAAELKDSNQSVPHVSAGSNHGHSHHGGGHGHSHMSDIVKDDFGLRCLLLLFALSIHSLFEGVALGLQTDTYQLVALFIGVAVHEILVAFAIGVNLAQQNLRVSTVVKLCLVFSLTIPMGVAIGMGLKGITSVTGQLLSGTVQGLTAGTFVYVTFLEILPAEINGNDNRMWKVFFMFLGFGVIAGLKFGMKESSGPVPVYYQPAAQAVSYLGKP